MPLSLLINFSVLAILSIGILAYLAEIKISKIINGK
jgi:hypothetical protein